MQVSCVQQLECTDAQVKVCLIPDRLYKSLPESMQCTVEGLLYGQGYGNLCRKAHRNMK